MVPTFRQDTIGSGKYDLSCTSCARRMLPPVDTRLSSKISALPPQTWQFLDRRHALIPRVIAARVAPCAPVALRQRWAPLYAGMTFFHVLCPVGTRLGRANPAVDIL